MENFVKRELDKAAIPYTTHKDPSTYWVHVAVKDGGYLSFQIDRKGKEHQIRQWAKGGVGGSYLVNMRTFTRKTATATFHKFFIPLWEELKS